IEAAETLPGKVKVLFNNAGISMRAVLHFHSPNFEEVHVIGMVQPSLAVRLLITDSELDFMRFEREATCPIGLFGTHGQEPLGSGAAS
ncbi:MAG: hypothetical protein ACKO0N_01640, partial [Planctomycetota bacterium]